MSGAKSGQTGVPRIKSCAIAPAIWRCSPQSLLAAREKRQGQNCLPSLIFYHHHQRQIILVAVLFSQLSDRVLGIRKCRRYIRQVCVTRMVLDPILSVYRKGISWHRTFQNRVTATAANKNEPQARYALKGSFVTSVGFGAERPGGTGDGVGCPVKTLWVTISEANSAASQCSQRSFAPHPSSATSRR